MQTSHLCCPSSSSTTSQYASSHVTQFVQSILTSAGFSKSSSQAIELLTEVFERYLLLLASTSKQHSNHVGRLSATPWDVEAALSDLGSSAEDIQRWFDEEGGDVAGRWLSGLEGTQGEEQDEAQRLGIPTAKLLGDRQKIGKAPKSESRTLLHFQDVDEGQRVELEALLAADDDEREGGGNDKAFMLASSDNGIGWMAQSPPPPYRSSSSVEPAAAEPPVYKKRKVGATFVDFIPAFLPLLPGGEEEAETLERPLESDAEYVRETRKRVQMGEERRELLNDDGSTKKTKEEREKMVLAAHDMAPSSKRSTEDSWHIPVEFASSVLAQQQSIDDIPIDVLDDEDHDTDARQSQRQTSSQRIFANDYLALVSEANSVPLTMLTPTGSAFVNAFNLRRALASHLADPSRYIPCDTIFGAIDARPSAAPFQPGPSLLITPPTTTNSAPTFTPIQAGGRELMSTSTINNSLHPICAHRKPNSVLIASRYLSGGQHSEMFRRITRTLDPIPILDERHAERVFHGAQASKDLLHDDNSFLREALDVLKMKRAEEVKAGLGDGSLEEQQSQLSMSANRDKLRVKSGTLVQTWDWMARDYTDPVLPGKKYRSGTVGVTVSSPAEPGEQQQVDRHRSESVQMA